MKRIFVVLSILLSVSIVQAKTLAEMITAERYALNDSVVTSHNPNWTDAELTIRNNDIQRQVAQYTRLIYVSSITTPTAEVREYPFPPKCITIDRVSFLQTTSTSSYKKLEAITIGGLDMKLPTWESNISGRPLYYYERGSNIGFERPVSASYISTGSIKIDYYKYPEAMVATTDEPFDGIDNLVDLYSDVIVHGVVGMCKKHEGKATEAATEMSEYVAGINSIIDTLGYKPDQATQHINVITK